MKGAPYFIRGWLLISVWAVVGGELLSILHCLNAVGYLGLLILSLATGLLLLRSSLARLSFGFRRERFRVRRWKRALPLLYLILLGLSLLGGLLYAPNNYDFLTYRLPRVLHWWSEDSWHWIDTISERMNYSGVGFEWLMAPLLILSHSDRLFFLINILSYAMLPGLFFQVALLTGVRPRVAWHWMWILPAGYCYVMQAGSASNDSYAAVYALASVMFFLRASRSGKASDFGWGIVAAALLTGAKASNLPLLLPCLIAALSGWKVFYRAWPRLIPAMLAAVLVSFFPLAVANTHYAGHWSGDPNNESGMRLKNPVAGILGNSIQLAGQSMAPPILPGAKKLTSQAVGLLPDSWKSFLGENFPRFTLFFGELPQEEGAGLGLGVTSLLLVSLAVVLVKKGYGQGGEWSVGIVLGVGSWIAFLAYLALMGSESTSRLLSSYYPLLLLTLLLLPGLEALTRKGWWRTLAGMAMASALIAVVLTPSRPLFPSAQVLGTLVDHFPENAQLNRARTVYQVYLERNDPMAGLRRQFPENTRVVAAVIGGNESEVSLWRPFGERRVLSLTKSNLAESKNSDVMIVTNQGMADRGIKGVDESASILDARIEDSISVTLTVFRGIEPCYLLISNKFGEKK